MESYILIIDIENWQIVKETNVMGVGGKWGKIIYPKLKVGDLCIFYITGISSFAGIFEISSLNITKKINWKSGSYPFQFEMKSQIIFKKFIPVGPHITKLKFIRNKNKWYTHFQYSKAFPKEDIEYLKNIK